MNKNHLQPLSRLLLKFCIKPIELINVSIILITDLAKSRTTSSYLQYNCIKSSVEEGTLHINDNINSIFKYLYSNVRIQTM